MMRARSSIGALALVSAMALFAAGCGGDPAVTEGATGGNVPTPTTPTPTTPGTVVDGSAPTGGTSVGAGMTAKVPEISAQTLRGRGVSGSGGGLFSPLAVEDVGDSTALPTVQPTTPLPTLTETPTIDAPSVVYTGARIYVDGMTHTVNIGESFPKDEPLFKLVSVTPSAIELELVAGEFTDGGGTGTVLDKGDLVSLLNASEQQTYKVKYLGPESNSSTSTSSGL